MPWKPKVKISLIKCGTCGKPYNNVFTHVWDTQHGPAVRPQMGGQAATRGRARPGASASIADSATACGRAWTTT